MSLFSAIKNAEHSFAAWVEKEWQKLYSAEPKIEQVADAVLKYVGPALETVVTLEAGGAAGSLVTGVINEARTDLAAASGLIYDFGPSPSIAGILTSVVTNLNALLAAGHVKSDKSVSAVQRVISELEILVAAVGTFLGATTTPAAPAAA